MVIVYVNKSRNVNPVEYKARGGKAKKKQVWNFGLSVGCFARRLRCKHGRIFSRVRRSCLTDKEGQHTRKTRTFTVEGKTPEYRTAPEAVLHMACCIARECNPWVFWSDLTAVVEERRQRKRSAGREGGQNFRLRRNEDKEYH